MRSLPLAAVLFACTLAPLSSLAQTGNGAPTFSVPASALSKHVTVIAYGDQRFHNPHDPRPLIADPRARVALVNKIASEHPDAVTMSGDVPYKGSDPEDYKVFVEESAPWREQHLRIYPALGNHELSGGAEKGLEDWWAAFPELRDMRWYSVALGDRIRLLQLDSMSALTPGSAQAVWLAAQFASLPPAVDFVMISLHHPPVADIQTHIEVDHNPRPNEIALRDYLSASSPTLHARIVVIAGHIHNYERSEVGGVTYLVSGGGGAQPYIVERTPGDLYQDAGFPNFHYVRFELDGNELKATMFRLADPNAKKANWQATDHFTISRK